VINLHQEKSLMKQALKLIACLLAAFILSWGMQVPAAQAQQVICDRSAEPTCLAELEPGECQELPLPGYQLTEVEIAFHGGDRLPAIYPPPSVAYELEVGFTQVSGELTPDAKSIYRFDSPGEGQICNSERSSSFPLPFNVRWENAMSPY
jgi:hypothetical protein